MQTVKQVFQLIHPGKNFDSIYLGYTVQEDYRDYTVFPLPVVVSTGKTIHAHYNLEDEMFTEDFSGTITLEGPDISELSALAYKDFFGVEFSKVVQDHSVYVDSVPADRAFSDIQILARIAYKTLMQTTVFIYDNNLGCIMEVGHYTKLGLPVGTQESVWTGFNDTTLLMIENFISFAKEKNQDVIGTLDFWSEMTIERVQLETFIENPVDGQRYFDCETGEWKVVEVEVKN